MSGDSRYDIAKREAIILLVLFLAYMVWWAAFAYGLGSRDPSEYTFIMGFPDWFFYSCILGSVVFSLILILVVKLFFKEVPLE